MKSSPNMSDEPPTPPDSRAVILLLRDVGNVTWRMFTPLLLGLGAGYLIDSYVDTEPWGIIGGLIVGLTGTVLLTKKVFKDL